MTTEPAAWRRYLDDLIRRMSPAEKQRLYTEVGVTRTTVQRWRNGENTPDPSHVHRLLNTLQQEEKKQLRTLMQDDSTLQMPEEVLTDELLNHIPQHVYEEVLLLGRNAPDQFWLLGGTILFHALSQLETTPQETGVEVLIARCMPPREEDGKIRSLWVTAGRGTPPWRTDFHSKNYLLGAESLGGTAVMQRHSIMVSDVHDPHTAMPFYSQEHERSCAAAPIMREGKVAGALIVSCGATHFFTEERLTLLERYADLIRMAFYDADFFDFSRIELAILPDWETQNTYFSSFRQRVSDEYKRSLPAQSMQELTTIETRVRQALEKELVQLGMLSKNPSH